MDFEPFVSVDVVAEFLSLSRRFVLELARSGTIPSHPIGTGSRKTWRFRISEVSEAVSRRKK